MMLLGLVSGVTVVTDERLDAGPSRVALPALAETLRACRVTISFASPELCRRLVRYCDGRGLTFPHLRRLMVGGAPLSAEHTAALRRLLPQGDVMLSLGSTEAMPATLISGAEALQKVAQPGRQNCGTCVGYALPGHTLRILPISDGPLASAAGLPPETTGEIAIRGPVVTRAYLDQPAQDALAKIAEGDDLWHRMGDLGFLDAQGCLWYCGRKSQRVITPAGTLYTLPCEQVFNRHPSVARCALVGCGPRGAQSAVIVIESAPGAFPKSAAQKARFVAELLALARQEPTTSAITHFAFYPTVFPVDIRHHSKISREKLAAWAARTAI
jgi:acyl-CoA synthetase (AMP-forming)/AMP-acid ligase II